MAIMGNMATARVAMFDLYKLGVSI